VTKKPLTFEGFVLLFTPSETNFSKSYFRDEITDVFHMLFYLRAGCRPSVNPINSQIT